MLQRPSLRAAPRIHQGLAQTQRHQARARQSQQTSQTLKPALTQDQQQSLKYLALAGLRLERELATALEENPFLTAINTHSAHDHQNWLSQIAAPGPQTLAAALRALASDIFWRAEDRAAADLLIDEVAPSGLLSAPLARLGLPLALTQARRIQAAFLGEGGLLADDLSQCLRAQLDAAGALDATDAVVLDALPLVAKKGRAQAAAHLGLSDAALAASLAKIARLSPRPADLLELEQPRLLPPDLLLEEGPDGRGGKTWHARLNPLMNRRYALDEEALSGLSPQAVRSAAIAPLVGQARGFVRALNARGKTLTSLTRHLALVQDAALRQGQGHMRPYSQGEAAAALRLHASTISRAVADKTVQTPQGTWPMKAFFSALIDPRTQFSAAQLRARITAHIREEPRAHPLSDAALARLIQAQGPQVARRTVTKYRLAHRVPGASMRKRAYANQGDTLAQGEPFTQPEKDCP